MDLIEIIWNAQKNKNNQIDELNEETLYETHDISVNNLCIDVKAMDLSVQTTGNYAKRDISSM